MPVFSKVVKDLQEERDKIAFNIEEFTNWYHGGAENVKDKRFFGKKSNKTFENFSYQFDIDSTENLFLNDPDLGIGVDQSYLSHKEKYEDAVKKSTILLKKLQNLQSEGLAGEDLLKLAR